MKRSRRRRRWIPFALAWLATTLAVPVLAQSAQADYRPAPAAIAWHACADADLTAMQCGSLQVPVDYAHPGAGTLTLAMVRRPADDQAHRQGTLLLNDGAGGSSIEQLRLAMRIHLSQFAGDMTQKFDLVAVDPRGVGHSTPLLCGEPAKPAGISYFPQHQAAFDRFAAWCTASDTCALHGQDVAAQYDALVAGADRTPDPHRRPGPPAADG
ncbi:hypothetical protein GCM10009665_60620 [Kitasatospora nipponensis]|uniref:Alpha/beta hydrolase family protein n=1 Tax=Kitasatospora nipponensis TaxID=258049 RepID=A0ABN1WS77_9ACTN